MNTPLSFYLETAAWSRLVDRSDPARRRATRRFAEWCRPRHFLLSSKLTVIELSQTADKEIRRQALRKYWSIRKRHVATVSEVRDVAWDLVREGCVTENHLADAFHVAYSIVGRAYALVTWDVHDLAREHTRRFVRDYCWRHGRSELRIGTPVEVGRWLGVKI